MSTPLPSTQKTQKWENDLLTSVVNNLLSWTEHIADEEVMTVIGEERATMFTIRKRQRKLIGHITYRGDSLLRIAIEEKKLREKNQEEDQDRWCWTWWWQRVMENWKNRPNNESSGAVVHSNLPIYRKQLTRRRHRDISPERVFSLFPAMLHNDKRPFSWLCFCSFN